MLWFVMERYVHCLSGLTYFDSMAEHIGSGTERKPVKTF
jgi:hypothetical protein